MERTDLKESEHLMTNRRDFLQTSAALSLATLPMPAAFPRHSVARPFVHLNVQTEYSLPSGFCGNDELVHRTHKLGMNAVAITGRNTLRGAIKFARSARALNLKPILGCTIELGSKPHFPGSDTVPKAILTLLAQNEQGLRNLCRLVRPRRTRDHGYALAISSHQLSYFSEGLICLSGHTGYGLGRFLQTDPEKAKDLAQTLAGNFGDRFYIELQLRSGEGSFEANDHLAEFAQRQGIPVVATAPVLYVRPGDTEAALVFEQFRSIDEAEGGPIRAVQAGAYLCSPEVMYAAFSEHPEAVLESQRIADRIDFQVFRRCDRRSTRLYGPVGEPDRLLRERCEAGLRWLYAEDPEKCPSGKLSQAVMDRLQRELEMIRGPKAEEALLVADLGAFARSNKMPVMLDGVCAGSLVLYALQLTTLCPLANKLEFEPLFQTPAGSWQQLTLKVYRRWFHLLTTSLHRQFDADDIAQLTYEVFIPASLIFLGVAKRLGIPEQERMEIMQQFPRGLHVTIEEALATKESLRTLHETNPIVQRCLDLSKSIQHKIPMIDSSRTDFLVSRGLQVGLLPMEENSHFRYPGPQWTREEIRYLNYRILRIDRAPRSFSFIHRVLDHIREGTGLDLDWQDFPLDDPIVFQTLAGEDNRDLFLVQLAGFREFIRRLQPTSFEELVAAYGLNRPESLQGVRSHLFLARRRWATMPNHRWPGLVPILQSTRGLFLFQEQVMQVLHDLAGVPRMNGLNLTRSISRETPSGWKDARAHLVTKLSERSVRSPEILLRQIEIEAPFLTSRSVSACRAQQAYVLAYLKTHFQEQYRHTLSAEARRLRG